MVCCTDLVEGDGGGVGDLEDVLGAEARSQQRLVGVTPRGVGDEQALVAADGLGEGLGPTVQVRLTQALLYTHHELE